MEANAHRISHRRVWAATLISTAAWGLGWFICMLFLLNVFAMIACYYRTVCTKAYKEATVQLEPAEVKL